MAIECKHPLIQTKLSIMRDERTSSKEFRESLTEIGSLMCYRVFEDCAVYDAEEITTPTGVKLPKKRLEKEIVLVPILRAGLGMVDGVRNMLPTARIGHIGMYRDEETLIPHEYYCKLPQCENPLVVLVDPMLATGGSAVDAIEAIKNRGYNNIRFMCLVAAPEGIKAVEDRFPDVKIFCASIDEKLNNVGYILPGLGDAGDRIFGTK